MLIMKNLIERRKEFENEFTDKLIQSENIFNEIYEKCDYKFDKNCGSYLFLGQVYEYSIEMYAKQKMLYDVAKNAESVLEIGTYMGHSALIMLLANPKLKLTCIDLSDKYSPIALDVLKKYFPEAELSFILGSSIDVIPSLNKKFDLFHIDGDHELQFVLDDFENTKKLASGPVYNVIFDDWHGERGIGSQLERDVLTNNKVKKYIVANCLYPNSYIEISL